jgi:hypothetical protein
MKTTSDLANVSQPGSFARGVRKLTLVLLLIAGSIVSWLRWSSGAERKAALIPGISLCSAISDNDHASLRGLIPAPEFLKERSPVERDELLMELIGNEISPEGLAVLARDGDFGPLKEIFPGQADSWAGAFGANADDCVAFRLQRNGTTAELVLHRLPDATYRVLRCNDIRQLAVPSPLP